MVGLILGVQKVELVGGESWLEHNTIALAAIAAAALAALVAILNRRAELRHDREMRTRDHIREVVDQSYAEATQAIRGISELLGVVQGTEEWRDEFEASEENSPDPVSKRLGEARTGAHDAIMNLLIEYGRLQMRLGQDHPIPLTLKALRQDIEALYDHLPSSLSSNRSREDREVDVQLRDEVGSSHMAFREACFKWITE